MPLQPSPIGIQSDALNAAHDAAVEDHKAFVAEQVAGGLTEEEARELWNDCLGDAKDAVAENNGVLSKDSSSALRSSILNILSTRGRGDRLEMWVERFIFCALSLERLPA